MTLKEELIQLLKDAGKKVTSVESIEGIKFTEIDTMNISDVANIFIKNYTNISIYSAEAIKVKGKNSIITKIKVGFKSNETNPTRKEYK